MRMERILTEVAHKCLNLCNFHEWSREWPEVGAYLGLECAEYVEAIREGDKANAAHEAADILFVLLSSLAKENIAIAEVLVELGYLSNGHRR